MDVGLWPVGCVHWGQGSQWKALPVDVCVCPLCQDRRVSARDTDIRSTRKHCGPKGKAFFLCLLLEDGKRRNATFSQNHEPLEAAPPPSP